MMVAETGVMQLQTREQEGLLAGPEAGKETWARSLLEASGRNLAFRSFLFHTSRLQNYDNTDFIILRHWIYDYLLLRY